jgi:two-component system, LytTR family, sensor kinase
MLNKQFTGIFSNRNLYFYIFYWIIYLLFFSTQRFFALRMDTAALGLTERQPLVVLRESFYTNLAFLPLVIIATHFVINFLLPRYYFRNRFFLFSIVLISLIFIYPVFIYVLRKLIVEPYILHGPMEYTWYNYFMAMLIFVFGMAPLVWFKMAAHLREDAVFHQKLDNDRLNALLKLKETELKLLKSQIHPHFLFNTLNNLYSLALEKSDKTPDLIIKLADMLSYIIYDCNSEKVPLTKEIDFINSFLELQKVRYDTCNITFNVDGELNGKQIAPMIIHTFVDNCFKHGAEKDSGNPWIRISILVSGGILLFTSINSTIVDNESVRKVAGIGISNAMKRLDLIYRGRHDLVIDNSVDRYSVSLKIEL